MKELSYEKNAGKLSALYFGSGNKNAPLIVEIHGGAFCFGKAKDDVGLCERLVGETGFNAVALDYGLAPRFRYPAQTEECADLVNGIFKDGTLDFNRSRVAIIGHSAGANLALNVAVKLGCFSAVILDYPWAELAENDRKYIKASIPDFWLGICARRYCPKKNIRRAKEVSPVYADRDYFKDLPATLLITCGCDSLREDGIALAKKFAEAGVDLKHVEYESARHGFIEIVSGGRMKENFYTSAEVVRQQNECYEKALAEITKFMREKV